jgi:GNAT superfamily N-acetyltransferase
MTSDKPTYPSLSVNDLDRIVSIDRRTSGTSRRGFVEKRLAAQELHPDAFVSMGALLDEELVGFTFCHIIEGEFGGTELVAVLDAIGVVPDRQSEGIGYAMLGELDRRVRERGCRELRTQARWNQRGLLDFFSRTGFSLAPRLVLECSTDRELE